jgi:hypothetical protein
VVATELTNGQHLLHGSFQFQSARYYCDGARRSALLTVGFMINLLPMKTSNTLLLNPTKILELQRKTLSNTERQLLQVTTSGHKINHSWLRYVTHYFIFSDQN